MKHHIGINPWCHSCKCVMLDIRSANKSLTPWLRNSFPLSARSAEEAFFVPSGVLAEEQKTKYYYIMILGSREACFLGGVKGQSPLWCHHDLSTD